MKIKLKLIVTLITVLFLVACSSGEVVEKTEEVKSENIYTVAEESSVENNNDNSPKLKTRTLISEEQDLLSLFGITEDYAVYEFDRFDFSKFTVFIETYENGKSISKKELLDIDGDEVSDDTVSLVIRPTYQDGLCVSITSDYNEWHEITSDEIGIPFEKSEVGTSGYVGVVYSTEKTKDYSLFYYGFSTSESKGFYNLDISNYSDEDLKGFDYCYIVKCVFK